MSIDLATHLLMRGAFFFLLFVCLIYTLLLTYHWFTYGASHKTTMTALIIYLSGVAVCFLTMGSLVV